MGMHCNVESAAVDCLMPDTPSPCTLPTGWTSFWADRHQHNQEQAFKDSRPVEVAGSPQYGQFGDKLIQLEAGDEEFQAIADKFHAGPGMTSQDITISGIYRNSHSSTTGRARLQNFKLQKAMTANLRGDANVRFGWHGTSRKGVQGIILHGFGQPRRPKNGASYGHGVYLAPENYSNLSAVYSDIDERGEHHMVLCQVILGLPELVQPGSEQFHPSGEGFDTGVDDLVDPKRYIIWSTHMNSHVLPVYVVSFKASKAWTERVEDSRVRHKLGSCCNPFSSQSDNAADEVQHHEVIGRSPSSGCFFRDGCTYRKSAQREGRQIPGLKMNFPELFTLLKRELPPANLLLLRQKYICYKAGKMSKAAWAKCLRLLVGDKKLCLAIRTLQAQVSRPLEKAEASLPECFLEHKVGSLATGSHPRRVECANAEGPHFAQKLHPLQ